MIGTFNHNFLDTWECKVFFWEEEGSGVSGLSILLLLRNWWYISKIYEFMTNHLISTWNLWYGEWTSKGDPTFDIGIVTGQTCSLFPFHYDSLKKQYPHFLRHLQQQQYVRWKIIVLLWYIWALVNSDPLSTFRREILETSQ